MKALIWLGSTKKDIRNCPLDVRREFGDGLRLVQLGQMPCDWKIMKGVGHGAKEIRVHVNNEYRLTAVPAGNNTPCATRVPEAQKISGSQTLSEASPKSGVFSQNPAGGADRLIYVDKFEVIYILHLFVKKTEKTLRRDIMLARSRYELLLKMRKS